MSTTILHISDTHGGQMSGMIAPDTELTYDDGEKRTITLSSTSLWIWEVVEKIIANVNDYAGEDQVYLYHTPQPRWSPYGL